MVKAYVKPTVKVIAAIPYTCLAGSLVTLYGDTDPFGITEPGDGSFENPSFEDELPW